ncbi:expressed protein, partial [Baffinella frigidus]
ATSLPVPPAPPPEPAADSTLGGGYGLGPEHYPREAFEFCGGEPDSPYCAPTRACGKACDIIWNDMKIVSTLADAMASVDEEAMNHGSPRWNPGTVCCGAQYRLRSYIDECAQYPPDNNLTRCSQLPFGKVALALASVAASPNGGEILWPSRSVPMTYMNAALALNSRMDLLSKETLAQIFFVPRPTISEVLASLRLAYVKKTAASWQGGARTPEPPQGTMGPGEQAPRE